MLYSCQAVPNSQVSQEKAICSQVTWEHDVATEAQNTAKMRRSKVDTHIQLWERGLE